MTSNISKYTINFMKCFYADAYIENDMPCVRLKYIAYCTNLSTRENMYAIITFNDLSFDANNHEIKKEFEDNYIYDSNNIPIKIFQKQLPITLTLTPEYDTMFTIQFFSKEEMNIVKKFIGE